MKFTSFKNWKIFNKIVSISVVNIILLFAFSIGILLPFIEKQMTDDINAELINITGIVFQLISEYDERATNGEFAVIEAQNRVKERIRGLRYANNEYFFIVNTDAVIVMHPLMPELEGKSTTEIKDPSGKALFVEMAKMVTGKGEGIISYLWPKPGQTTPAPKQSYIKLYKPWGWGIGTGIYVDDVKKEIKIIRYGIITAMLACSLFILLLSWVVARRICSPLFEVIETSKRLAQGDLTGVIEVESSDETGQLMQAMQQMIAGLKDYQHSQNLVHEYQKRLALIIETTDDGIIAKDLEGNIHTWNRGAEKIFGYTSDEIVGKPFSLLIPESLTSEEQSVLERLKTGERIDHFETVRRAKGGRQVHVSLTISPIRDNEAQIIGDSNIVRDITERKRVEKALRASEDHYRALFNKAGEGICILSQEGIIIEANESFARMHGFEEREMVNMRIDQLDVFKGFDNTPDRKDAVLSGGAAIFEVQHYHKDGRLLQFEVTVSPITLREEAYFLVFHRDITERKRLEEERKDLENQLILAQKLESLGVLAGGIAHDFNNILAIIVGYCGLIKMEYEEAEIHIPEIEKAAERAAGLCRQMLAYAGHAQLSQTHVNMWTLVDEMIKMLRATIPQNVAIYADLAADIPPLIGDDNQIRQIIMNLVINASEAIGEAQGEVRVSLINVEVQAGQSNKDHLGKKIPPGCYICLEVSDNGRGMDEETRQRLFEPFYTTKFAGRGLGMSAVLGIITAHNGALQMRSQPGKGTTITVYLLVKSGDSAVIQTNQQAASPATWQGSGTILLVEDEAQIIFFSRTILEKLGFTVITACNGGEALEKYQRYASEVFLVITDMDMPVMDGYTLFRELKAIRSDLPIIISSGFGDSAITAKIPREEIAGLVIKPFNLDQMRELIKGVVEGTAIEYSGE
ncbi:MAG: PAS domain S-box protein [Desulfuromonadaceae bacterium]|nr:PAS domain S-box protein [Desulfuromonadaceae bacterium]MDD5106508.1 PAS domain S-box protein [Desulfuromonadaceae bacterium]